MTDISTPAGRLVQGSMKMQQRKDQKTKQPVVKPDGTPDMGCFFSLAFPKFLPNGQANGEFASFWQQLNAVGAAAWPQFFPQGAAGSCSNPKFSWKYQDGDGVDSNGQSVAGKPGFKGHHIIKFDTSYPVKVFNEGRFAPQDEIVNADLTVKRGFWVRVFGEAKSNNADLSKQQVPGISIYPKLVSFLGGRPEDEIASGPDAQQAFGGNAPAWRPDGISQVPGAPVGTLPVPPSTAVPAQPTYVIRADLAAQGHTMQTLSSQGATVDQLVAAGYVTIQQPVAVPVVPAVPAIPAVSSVPSLPPVGGPSLAVPGVPGVALGALPVPGVPPVAAAPAVPQYALIPGLVAQGVTMDSLLAKGWTHETLVQHGHATRVA